MARRAAEPSGVADVASHLAEGERALEEEDSARAAEHFRAALALDPDSAVARSKLGAALAHAGEHAAALETLRMAIERHPTYAPAYSNLGNVYREMGRLDDAIAAYRRAIELDPAYWVPHQNLAIVYKQQGRIREFVAEMKIANRLSIQRPARQAPEGRRAGCLGRTAALVVVAGAAAALAVRGASRLW